MSTPVPKSLRIPLILLLALLGAGLASALPEEEDDGTRALWQARYRTLLQNRAILEDNIARLEHAYTQAQQRKYPRGAARESLRVRSEEQRERLAELQQEIDSIYDEARIAGVPPGWLSEVEDEPVVLPGAPATTDADARAGRNPLWLEDAR